MSNDTAGSEGDQKRWQELLQKSDSWWKPYLDKAEAIKKRHPLVSHFLKNGGHSLSGYHPNEQFSKFESEFVDDQTRFKDTCYHCEVSGKKFVHFTSLQACMEILSTGLIRMYNPSHGNDPNEIVYAANQKFDNELQAQHAIHQLFTLSLCDETVLEDLLMWRFYGADGGGVALVFEFENSEENWSNWYFGRVQYGETEEHKQLEAFHEDLKQEFGENKSPKIDLDLMPLYAFHKSKLFHTENENRLLFRNQMIGGEHQDNDATTFGGITNTGVSITKVLTKDFRESYYCAYPIFWPQSEKELEENAPWYYNHGPRIRLKRVELGFRYKDEDAAKLSLYAHSQMSDRFPADHGARVWHPDVSVSKLKGAFR